jgi:hypothetical protein
VRNEAWEVRADGTRWNRFKRILARAGLTPWPRLFQNLRASRETELMREYDLATVCGWIGNSPEVAAKHYAMSVDLNADFRRTTAIPVEQAQQKAQQSAAISPGNDRTTEVDDNTKTIENTGKT